jgi:hypothetical protein
VAVASPPIRLLAAHDQQRGATLPRGARPNAHPGRSDDGNHQMTIAGAKGMCRVTTPIAAAVSFHAAGERIDDE